MIDQEGLSVQFLVVENQGHTKDVNMVVVPACMALSMKYEPQSKTDQPCVSILRIGGLACGPMTCDFSEAGL